jgi:hypothetical protein
MRKMLTGTHWPMPLLGLCVAAVSVVGGLTLVPTAGADGGCIPGDIAGQVPRAARAGDIVCVPRSVAQLVQNENEAAADGQGYAGGGAYGPKTCVSGLVWREAFDGDAVCVSPARRTETWQENANAGVGATGGLKPQQPPAQQSPAQQSTMVWKGTGSGTTYNVVIDDDKNVQTFNGVPLPYSHTESLTAKPGQLFQVVVSGKGDAKVGCEIDYNGQVVASQPVNDSSAQCIWNVPPAN